MGNINGIQISGTLATALEARLAAMKGAGTINPWSEAEEKVRGLAEALVEPYQLDPFEEMRASEVAWGDTIVEAAAKAAIEAAELVLVERLLIAWSQPPVTLIDHPASKQLRADLAPVTA